MPTRTPVPETPDPPAPRRRPSGAAEAVAAVSRLLSAGHSDPAWMRDALTSELRELLGAEHARLLPLDDPAVQSLREASVVLTGPEAQALTPARPTGSALLLALPDDVLVLTHPAHDAFGPDEVGVGEALATAASAALARDAAAAVEARRADRQAALTRATKTLHESLDLPTVLSRICLESTRILDGDYTAVYRGTTESILLEASYGLPPELIGFRLDPGQGLSGKVLSSQRSMLTNEYQGLPGLPPEHPFMRVKSCLAVPMQWDGELRGVLTVGYTRPFEVTEEHLEVLETFAELASVACANADAHAGLVQVARTDGLTGCLNHAALHETLGREIERAERAVAPTLSLIMFDLDDFKSVNEVHGHLVGDEVLRRAGHALRHATRPYDVAARYGGDEFALIAVEADEAAAEEIARRTIERITFAIGDMSIGSAGQATAGVAEWASGITAGELVARADRALLFGKHETGRGSSVPFSSLPEWFLPGRFARRGQEPAVPERREVSRAAAWPTRARPSEERLRQRARRLAWASGLGVRLTGMDDPAAILGTAASELAEALDAATCTVLRRRADEDQAVEHAAGSPLESPELAARVVTDGRPVLAAAAAARSRIAVPLVAGGTLWGAIEVHATHAGAFDEDDLQLAEVASEHTGAALHAAQRLAEARRAAGSGA